MGALIGPPTGLEEVKGSSKLVVGADPRHTYNTTLGGIRRAYRGPSQRRVWEVQVGAAKPHEWHLLQQLNAGVYDDPLVWYDEYAQVTNILPPDVSMCTGQAWENAEQAGARSPVVTDDGARFLSSVQAAPDRWVRMPVDVPVPTNRDVVISAYITPHPGRAARLLVRELDIEGTILNSVTHSVPQARVLERAVIAFRTSSQTVALSIHAHHILTLALPSVTLTQRVLPWATGRGCHTAVLEIEKEDVQLAVETTNDWGRLSQFSYTVTEIG